MARKPKPISPHSLRQGDTVYQRYCPWNVGTVSHVERGVSFTVVYNTPDRKPRQPRDRYTYAASQQDAFLLGYPPVVTDPEPVNVEAFTTVWMGSTTSRKAKGDE